MTTSRWLLGCLLLVMAISIGHTDETPAPMSRSQAAPAPTIEQARREAAQLHTVVHSTLQIVHHRYYREDEGLLLPAATLKEVFADVEQDHGIQLRWLAVEGQVMNTDHEARDDFEKAAVKALRDGQDSYEQVIHGRLQRAAPITLSNHCLKCHVPDRKSTEDRTAGLVISVPVASH